MLMLADPRHRQEMGVKEEASSEELEQLLLTILVPAFPPNRSQWKKLEVALNFIKKSRTRTGSRTGRLEAARCGGVTCYLAWSVQSSHVTVLARRRTAGQA